MKKIISLTTALFLFLCTLNIAIYGQVKTKVFYSDIPLEFKTKLQKTGFTQVIEAPQNFYALKSKKSSEEEIQFALDVQKTIDFIKEAKVEKDNGVLKYTFTLTAKDAFNISLQFGKFKLSKNAVLSLYTKNELTENITSKENNENNVWATRVYQGNTLTLQLNVPIEEKENIEILINTINFGYRNFGTSFDFGNIGASAACEINANCPIGNNWANEKNSVAMIVANGIVSCTGSLIMNSCSNNTPYFLTANHCLGAGNVPNWVFQFQTLSATCNGNTGWREDIQFNGCTLRANNGASDFALLQLNNTPLSNSGLVYSGWSRNTAGNNATTILHHPQGDLMKISQDNDAPAIFDDIATGVQCWFLNLDNGIVEGGSSGAPYYNQNHQIIGQHFRRPQNVGNPPPPACNMSRTLGGRFDQSWTGGGTNSTRLSNWLDPIGSNVMTTNTSNISSLPNPGTPPAGNVIGYFTTNPQPQSGGSGSTQTPLANDTYQSFYVPRNSYVSMNFVVTTPTFPLYLWTTSLGNSNASGLNYSSSVQASPYGYGSVQKTIYLDAGNLCGTKRIGYTFNVVSLGWSFRIAAGPNPTKENLNVSISIVDEKTGEILNNKNYQKSSIKTNNTTFTLYEVNSTQLVKQWKFSETDNMNYNINVKGLKLGLYVLKMERDGQSTTTKILIQ